MDSVLCRFAKSRGEATIEGHRGGFHTLAETLQWCRRLGVQEVRESNCCCVKWSEVLQSDVDIRGPGDGKT